MQEQNQPGVLDTLAVWYISLLASTAKAAIPVAPHLRDVIIAQSRYIHVHEILIWQLSFHTMMATGLLWRLCSH